MHVFPLQRSSINLAYLASKSDSRKARNQSIIKTIATNLGLKPAPEDTNGAFVWSFTKSTQNAIVPSSKEARLFLKENTALTGLIKTLVAEDQSIVFIDCFLDQCVAGKLQTFLDRKMPLPDFLIWYMIEKVSKECELVGGKPINITYNTHLLQESVIGLNEFRTKNLAEANAFFNQPKNLNEAYTIAVGSIAERLTQEEIITKQLQHVLDTLPLDTLPTGTTHKVFFHTNDKVTGLRIPDKVDVEYVPFTPSFTPSMPAIVEVETVEDVASVDSRTGSTSPTAQVPQDLDAGKQHERLELTPSVQSRRATRSPEPQTFSKEPQSISLQVPQLKSSSSTVQHTGPKPRQPSAVNTVVESSRAVPQKKHRSFEPDSLSDITPFVPMDLTLWLLYCQSKVCQNTMDGRMALTAFFSALDWKFAALALAPNPPIERDTYEQRIYHQYACKNKVEKAIENISKKKDSYQGDTPKTAAIDRMVEALRKQADNFFAELHANLTDDLPQFSAAFKNTIDTELNRDPGLKNNPWTTRFGDFCYNVLCYALGILPRLVYGAATGNFWSRTRSQLEKDMGDILENVRHELSIPSSGG